MASKKFRLWCRTDRGGVSYYRFPGGSWQSTNTTDRAAAETHVNDILNAPRTAQVLRQELPNDKAPAGATTRSLRESARSRGKVQKKLARLYDKAWPRPAPRQKCRILRFPK